VNYKRNIAQQRIMNYDISVNKLPSICICVRDICRDEYYPKGAENVMFSRG